jgi:IS4 transposase
MYKKQRIGTKSIDADFATMLSRVVADRKLINIPKGAEYGIEDVMNVLLFAHSSCGNSIESAVAELKRKNPEAKIPSADTIHNYIKTNKIDDIVSSFRKINREFLAITKIPATPQDAAADFHDVEYYGDRNTPEIRGIKPKNGTSWAHSFLTIDLIGAKKITLDVKNVNGLNKNYSVLLNGILDHVRSMKIILKTLFLDREFFNSSAVSTLDDRNVNFIMAAKSNQKIDRLLKAHVEKEGRTPLITNYQFKDVPSFYLICIPNPNYDPLKKKGAGNREFFLFATNTSFNSVEEFIQRVPEEYRKRWNIETGYRVKNEFKIRTCSRSPVTRVLLFIFQCILYNYLNLLKRVLCITAFTLKSVIEEDVLNRIRNFIPCMSLKRFFTRVERYNLKRELGSVII